MGGAEPRRWKEMFCNQSWGKGIHQCLLFNNSAKLESKSLYISISKSQTIKKMTFNTLGLQLDQQFKSVICHNVSFCIDCVWKVHTSIQGWGSPLLKSKIHLSIPLHIFAFMLQNLHPFGHR